MILDYTSRRCVAKLMIDTNAINARQRNCSLNQIEKWRADGVVSLLMPSTAFTEADTGGDEHRSDKALRQIQAHSARISDKHHQTATKT